jgi:spore coat polysaccharide biosynthesis protein SpsF
VALSREEARALAVVQARMSSSRLPGKALVELDGRRALDMVLDRLERCRELAGTIVATSDDPSDDALVVALAARVPVLRGPLDDVLTRYELAAREHPSDAVVRVTADCPLIDPEVVDLVVSRWRASDAAYAANVIEPRTFPKGMDTEVMTVEALRAAAAEATDPFDREHVTPFIRSRPERFPQESVRLEPPAADLRLVLDTREDLTQLRAIVERHGHDVGMAELVEAARG